MEPRGSRKRLLAGLLLLSPLLPVRASAFSMMAAQCIPTTALIGALHQGFSGSFIDPVGIPQSRTIAVLIPTGLGGFDIGYINEQGLATLAGGAVFQYTINGMQMMHSFLNGLVGFGCDIGFMRGATSGGPLPAMGTVLDISGSFSIVRIPGLGVFFVERTVFMSGLANPVTGQMVGLRVMRAFGGH